jgi:hypothetical protein
MKMRMLSIRIRNLRLCYAYALGTYAFAEHNLNLLKHKNNVLN